MLRLLKKLYTTGTDTTPPPDGAKYILSANFITITIQLLILPYSVVFWLLGAPFHAVLLLCASCLFVLVYAFNKRGWYLAARFYMLTLALLCLYYFGASFGQAASVHYVILVFFTIPFLLFPLRQHLHIGITLLVFVFTFFAMEYEWLPIPVVLSRDAQDILHGSMLTLTIVWIASNYIYFEISNRRTEQKLKAINRELKEKNKELEQFAYIASHDLQEPLLTLNSFSKLLVEEYGSAIDSGGKTYLKYISDAATRMSQLVKGLMEYNRLGMKREVKPVDTRKIMNDVAQDLTASAQKRGAVIEYDGLPVVKGYETELRLLFQNLVGNAIKFNKPDTPPIVQVVAKEMGHYWLFSVADNGIGIEDKYLEKIFLIFQRLHRKGDYEGTGIGLAHCKKIVELHRGRIWAESIPGEGSTFYFTIPH